MLKNFIKCAEVAIEGGGQVSFEWPRRCTGWMRAELIQFVKQTPIICSGCRWLRMWNER